jgi:hypothetical protein
MSRSLGNLRVDLTANTVQFAGSIDQARKLMRAFAEESTAAAAKNKKSSTDTQGYLSRIGGALLSLKALAVGAFAAIGVVKLAGQFKQAAETVDDLGKKAKRLGLSVGGLSALRFAAGQSGLEFDTLAKLAGKAQKNVAEFARTGKGETGAALRELGINAEDANGKVKGFAELLPEIARKMKDLAPGTQQDLATTIFGREGGEQFLTWLADSGDLVEVLAEKTEQARRLGVIFTEEQVQKLTAYNDAVERVGEAWLGLRVKLMTEVAPFLTEVADKAASLVAALPEIVTKLFTTVKGVFSGNLSEQAILELARLGLAVSDLVEHIVTGAMTVAILTMRAGFLSMPRLLAGVAADMADQLFVQPIANAVTKVLGAIGADKLAMGLHLLGMTTGAGLRSWSDQQVGESIRQMRLETGDAVGAFSGWGRELLHLSGNVIDALDGLAGVSAAMAKTSMTGIKASEAARAEVAQVAGLQRLWGQFLTGWRAGAKELLTEAGNIRDLGHGISTLIGRDLAGGTAKALSDAAMGTQKFGKSMREVLKNLAGDVLTTINRFIFLRAIAAGLGYIFPAGGPGIEAGASNTIGGIGGSPGIGPSYGFPAGSAAAAHGAAVHGGRVVPLARGGVLRGPLSMPMAGGGSILAGEKGPLTEAAFAPLMRIGGDLGVKSAPAEVTLQIIDQRSGGEPVSTRQTRGEDGGRVLQVFIRDAVNQGLNRGEFDKSLGANFGVARRGAGR